MGIVDQGRRPLIVEVTGTPKSGKSTSIAMMAGFFAQAGWTVHVVRERAEICPLVMKGHFFFNTWTACTMLAELIDVVDSEMHLVILDRGLFDAAFWLQLQKKRKQVTDREVEVFTNFMTLERWSNLEDLVLLLQVDPSKAMDRERLGQLVPRTGSLMNPATL